MSSMSGDGAIMRLMRIMMLPEEPGPYLAAAALMWIAMMVAMMIPAALPMLAVYRQVDRSPSPGLDAFIFACGYLGGWSAYALSAAALQWWLHARGWLHGMMLTGAAPLSAALLIAAGVYQLTPLKDACLARCRSPLGFFLANWRPGRAGAFAMGLHHGLFCIGCCWSLMLLMFVGGAMSVATMAVLCAFVLAERLLPAGPWVRTIPGIVLIGWGAALAVAS
jgi:predicted metal-binding membrane protein